MAKSKKQPKIDKTFKKAMAQTPLRRGYIKFKRNDKCPCGSGEKYKKCCYGQKFRARITEQDGVKTLNFERMAEV